MIKEEYILKCIEPYLNNKRELSEFEFFELFNSLTKKEQYEVIKIMIANDIEYVDEKENETKALKALESSRGLISEGDYKNLIHLSNEQLCLMYQQGNDLALTTLVKKNERFIYQHAIKISKHYAQTCMTIDDLYQIGTIGFIESVKKFDHALDFSLLTYSWHWIRQSISRAIIDEGYIIRIPVHMFEKMIKVTRYRRENPIATQDELIDLILAVEGNEESGMTRDIVKRCLVLSENYLNISSLNILIGEDGDTELIDLLPVRGEISVEEMVVHSDLVEKIDTALHSLKTREEEVIRARFGLDTGVPLTLEAVGNKYNVTRERIRQIEAKALLKLRRPSLSKSIKSFYIEE